MAADNFNSCLAETLKWEGGYVNNPRDPGGPTNCGITIATLSHELGRAATINDVRNLSIATASDIYRKKYWNLIGGDALPKGVDMMLFDIAVNNGPGRALQWGRQAAQLDAVKEIGQLDALRRSFWRRLASFVTFGRGWFNRENDIVAVARKMAA